MMRSDVSLLDGERRAAKRFAEPGILFPVIALASLLLVWTTTFELIHVQRSDAEHAAAESSREMLGTYEAQVVRALREIDQSMNWVKYWHATRPKSASLAELSDRGLLPPDLLFTVSIANSDGIIVDSTRAITTKDVSQVDYFVAQRNRDRFYVGQPSRDSGGNSILRFSRRLDSRDGGFDGVVVVAVDGSYFVSGYDSAKLGVQGVLGIVGTDGVLRVRRVGEAVASGGRFDYAAALREGRSSDDYPRIVANGWDDVPRWTLARELFGFPIAVIVGVAVDEQLATAHKDVRRYVQRAALGSLIIVLVLGRLGRLSSQLTESRLRESEAKLAHARRVEFLAYHDALTGLPNRSLFSKLLAEAIGDSRRHGRPLAVAFLDLDRFKQINDTLGHEAGDQLLKEVAARLNAGVRTDDTVARLGGDEFVVLLPDIDERQAGLVAQKILSLIGQPFTLIGNEFLVTASIGISAYPHHGLDEQTLTKNADIAMYQAKAKGKNNFQFYSETLNANSLQRLGFESALRHALQRDEFRLWYQAKRDVETGLITGMEALLRWQHPELGLLVPARFLSIAEESGITVPIGRWVIRTACAQNVAWQRSGLPRLRIAINLTSRQFYDERLPNEVSAALSTTGMEADLLEIEIAENLLIRDLDATLRILTALRELGVRVAIDEFGTGYTKLSTLPPLDTIKIHRSFIRTIANRQDNAKLVDAVIALARSLSLAIVAQGVETREEAELLRANPCDEIQGYLFDRPLQAEDFQRLLAAQNVDTYIGERLGVSNA
jgi:diguanylate cyclase (GGDEF)-like protein